MGKSVQYILYIILAITIVSIFFTLSGNSNIKSIQRDLKKANLSADSALNALAFANEQIDSLHKNIGTLQSYVTHAQKSVALDEARKNISDKKGAAAIKRAQEIVDSLEKDLKSDSLRPTSEFRLKIKKQL